MRKINKKGEFTKSSMVGKVSKIPTTTALNELAGVDFSDILGDAACLRTRDTLEMFRSRIHGGKKNKKATRVLETVIHNRISIFGKPTILFL